MRSKPSAAAIVLVALLALPAGLGTLAAADAASSATFGSQVTVDDEDVTYSFSPSAAGPALLCFVDDDADAVFDATERVYLAFACGVVSGNDVRVANAASPGSQVRAADADFGDALTALPGATDFFDANGDGVFGLGDTMHWDTDGSGTVSVSDLVLSGDDAGLAVDAGFPELGDPLSGTAPGLIWSVFDANGDTAYSRDDVVYADMDGSGDATVADIRFAPSAAGGFGSVVGPGDVDATYTFSAAAPPALVCFVDDDADAVFDHDEAVYLAASCATVAGNDLRVANVPAGFERGSQVRGSHSDFGNPLVALTGAAGFFDANGDGVFGASDTMYWDTDGSGTVSINDLVLSGADAGNVSASGDADLNDLLSGTAPVLALSVFDANGDTAYNSGDEVYADLDQNGGATVADIRLTPSDAGAFGSVVAVGDADVTYTFSGAPAPAIFCFVDDDTDGMFDNDEPVYLASSCATVAGNDLRVSNVISGQVEGSQVRASHNDFGNPLVALAGAADFFDANGDGVFSLGDTMYWDTDASGTVSINDLVLSGDAAGDVVDSTTPARNDPLSGTAPAFGLSVFDANGDTVYNRDDDVYADMDGSGGATVGDLRFVPGAASEPEPQDPGPLEAQIQQLLAQNAALNAQLNDSLAQNAQLQAQVNQLTAQLATLEQQLDALLAQNARQAEQIAALVAQMAALLEENTRLRAELQGLTGNLPPLARIAPIGPVECTSGRGTVLLDGSASLDPEGAPLDYAWEVFGGSLWLAHGPFAFANLTLGEHAVALGVSDGELLDLAVQAARVVDTLPPEASLGDVAGLAGANGWWRSPVEVGLAASDRCEVRSLHWSVAGPAPAEGSGDRVVLWRDGAHALRFFAQDRAGHFSNFVSLDVRVDQVPPATRLALQGEPGDGGWWRSAVVLSPSVSDATSGPASLRASIDGGPERVLAYAPGMSLATLEASGEHRAAFGAVDLAGNAEAQREVVVRIDREPPASAAAVRGERGDHGWWRSDVAVDLAARDATSGVAAVYASVDGGPFEPAHQVAVRGDGAHTVAHFAVDRAGNAEAVQAFEVLIDATAPDAAMGAPRPDTLHLGTLAEVPLPLHLTVVVGAVNVTARGDDATSGLHRFELWVDGEFRAAAAPGNGSGAVFGWHAGDEAAGEHVVEVRAVDRAGNPAAVERGVLTVPTTPQGLSATAGGCEDVLAAHLCAALPGGSGDPAAACRRAFSEELCATPSVVCAEVLAERLCGLATHGGPAELPGAPRAALALPSPAAPG